MSYASFVQCDCGNRQQVLRHPERLRYAECTGCRRILEVHPGDFRLYAKSALAQDHPYDRVVPADEALAVAPKLLESETTAPSRTLGVRELIIAYLRARESEKWNRGSANYHWAHFYALAAALDVPLPELLQAPASHNKPFEALELAALRQFQGIDTSQKPLARPFAFRHLQTSAKAWLECITPFEGYLEGTPFPDFTAYYDQIIQSQAAYREALVSYMVRLVELVYGPRRGIPASFLGKWGNYDASYQGDLDP